MVIFFIDVKNINIVPMNTSMANIAPSILTGIKGGVLSRRCISEVKEQKSIIMSAGDGFNFDFVGDEDVT